MAVAFSTRLVLSPGAHASHMHPRQCVASTSAHVSGPSVARATPVYSNFRLHNQIFVFLNTRKAVKALNRRTRVKLSALFGQASEIPINQQVERSDLVNQEVVLFIFQLELDTQLQRALTYERFDVAQDIRQQREQIDAAVKQLQVSKGAGSGARQASGTDVADIAAEGLRLRSEMQRAIEKEEYQLAAKMRDQLKDIESKSALAQAQAAEWKGIGEPRFRLGQRITHIKLGYRAVVCGWDLTCCETPEWQQQAGVLQLPRQGAQYFYHLLVDNRDWRSNGDQPPVAYVAEDLLAAPEEPATWIEAYGEDPLQHPYRYLLFLGQDGAGDMVPCRQLRDKYSSKRRDVYSSGEESDDGEDGDGQGEP